MGEEMKCEIYKIGEFCFQLQYPADIRIPDRFQLFQTETGSPEYYYSIICSDKLPQFQKEVIASRCDLCVMQSNEGDDKEIRMIGVKGTPGFYASYQEISENRAEIILRKEEKESLSFDPIFTSLLALERRMIQKNSLILHCSYLRNREQAILFSGPSGIGKSTQAGLWEKYRNAEVLNGDRALLRKSDGKWLACGWPVCGSSEICINENTPIRAIVLLDQNGHNQPRLLSPVQAFTQLYNQITVNRWNKEAQEHAMNLLERIISEIPVFYYPCDISEDAVLHLERAL